MAPHTWLVLGKNDSSYIAEKWQFAYCTSMILSKFSASRPTCIACLYCNVACTESWRSIELREMYHLCGKRRLSLACNTARQIGIGLSYYQGHFRLITARQRDGVEMAPWIMPRMPMVFPKCWSSTASLTNKLVKDEPRTFDTLMKRSTTP